MMSLNATNIQLKSLRIAVSQDLADSDASGQTSNTDLAEKGMKAKKLTVSGFIPFSKQENLTELFSLAEAVENGARVIYRINNQTASALSIKQVRFSSKIEAVEQESTRQWRVSFTLVEYRSVPEKKEQRLPDTAAAQQGGTGGGGEVTETQDQAPPETEPELTGFTAFLKGLDESLA